MIVLVGGTKGGTGKTTVAVNLAAWLAKAGRDVLLIDTDRQCSAMQWAELRASSDYAPIQSTVAADSAGVAEAIRKASKAQTVIIDAGGFDSPELRAAMLLADVMIVPCRPGLLDWFALATFAGKVVSKAHEINPKLRARILLNFMPARGGDEIIMRASCDAVGNIKPFGATLHQRRAYADAAGAGAGVCEWSDQKAVEETYTLVREVFNGR